jgi:hypothetical protein
LVLVRAFPYALRVIEYKGTPAAGTARTVGGFTARVATQLTISILIKILVQPKAFTIFYLKRSVRTIEVFGTFVAFGVVTLGAAANHQQQKN